MAWITTKGGKHINTDWFEKDKQIAANKEEADRLNSGLAKLENESDEEYQKRISNYAKASTKQKELMQKSPEELNELLIELRKKYNNTRDIENIYEYFGLHSKPSIVESDKIDPKNTLYRGVRGDIEKIKENFLFSDKAYLGKGMAGDGFYFTPHKDKATDFSDGGKGYLFKAGLSDKANAVWLDNKSMRKAMSDFGIAKLPGNNLASRFSIAALWLGYNAIRDGDDWLILDRSILEIAKN